MPFKWRLKKTRRYDISSKNSFIVGVYLLDNTFLECTLSSDSTGQECLDSIAQRIDLVDTFYFGLRFITKKVQFQWVDLSKPLKKQLDKMAEASHQPPCLYFGIMFYVSGAHKIQDEAARYHYYLQLKNDVIDGRVPTAYEQATRLATFSLQAEFGDYDCERHTVEYFKENNIQLFPKAMTKTEQNVVELLMDTLNMHSSLVGYHPLKAVIQYIKEVQLMDGYGMEYYTAKDDQGKELYLGTSVTGIFARYLDRPSPLFFRWGEIAKLSQNKKMIEIDTSKSSGQYQMEDSDMAKYFARMAQQQLKFYKSCKSNLNDSLTELHLESNDNEATVIADLPQVILPQSDSQELTNSQTSLVYHQDHRYSQEFQQQQQQQSQQQLAPMLTEDYYNNSQQSLDKAVPDIHPRAESDPGIHGGVYGSQQTPVNQTPVSQNDPSYSNRSAMLPAYRQAPSYEAVMRHRGYQQQQPQQHQQQQPPDVNGQNLGNSQIYAHSEGNAYSQPEIRQHVSSYPSETQYVNASAIRNYSHSIYANVFHDGHNYYAYRSAERGNNLAVHPTYSSPELNTQGLPEQYSDNMMSESLAYQYRPPPPYPRASSSTPDLAVQTGMTSANQAPDLLPQQSLGTSNLATQSRLDKSIDNLSEVIPAPKDVERVLHSEQDKEDTSSENSYATFHAKESDSSDNESLKRGRAGSEKSKIQVCLVDSREAPPPSKSKEVATLRESFRRMMIARSGSMNSGKQKPVIHITSNGGKESDVKTAPVESVLPRVEEQTDSGVQGSKLGLRPPASNTSTKETKPAPDSQSRKSDSDAESIQCLDMTKVSVEPASVHKATDSVDSTHSQQDYDDGSDSDVGSVDDATVKRVNMGPLKMAAMNGLSLSRPMVLALMNDESRAPKDERRKILESKISEGQVFVEFEEVPKKVPNNEFTVAKQPQNENRNRFKDVLPYDSTRVKLAPKKDNPSGYINASHIKLEAENNDWWFIATQAPLENTVMDFWQMIWEQEVNVIAMLTALKELGKTKCFPYWPQEPGVETRQTFGDFEVTLEFTDNSLCYVTSRIVVRHLPSSKERLIWHLQYTDWPDHGCPEDIYGFLGFLDEIDSVRRLAESDEGSGKKAPVVVHCSAGVGRTGVVILTMVMKWCLEHNHSVDLPKALEGIRKQRMYMVQTLGQYQFIHKTLIQYLKNTRLI